MPYLELWKPQHVLIWIYSNFKTSMARSQVALILRVNRARYLTREKQGIMILLWIPFTSENNASVIHIAWSESLQGTFWIAKDAMFLHADNKDCSDCIDMQADESSLGPHCRPRWLSWMRRPTGDQEVAGSTPAEVGNILSWRLIMKYFLRSFSPFRWFKKGSCQFLAKECAQYWLTA